MHWLGDKRHRAMRKKFSSQPFFLSILCFAVILTLSLASQARDSHVAVVRPIELRRRGLSTLYGQKDLECNLVHKATDKCAFVKENCADEEAGLFSYLTFYYCNPDQAQPFSLFLMVIWLSLLFSTIGIAASDFFCPNLSTISRLLGLSESLAGVTFLAFGNGSADVFSTFAAFNTNSGSLAVGELIGAAGFITAVVAGSMAITRPFKVARRSFVRDVVFFIVASGFSMVFLYDGKLYLWECATMIGFYVFYVIAVVIWHWWMARRRKRRLVEAAARAHYIVPGHEDAVEERYQDDEDGNDVNIRRSTTDLTQSDFSALESGNGNVDMDEEDEAEEAQRELGQLKNQMRLSLRPQLGGRKATQSTIRPSLVGALEFRAVLAGLQKSRNIHTMPLYLRRYSDDSSQGGLRNDDRMSTVSDPSVHPNRDGAAAGEPGLLMPSRPGFDARTASGNRARAVSAPNTDSLRHQPGALPTTDLLGPLSDEEGFFKPIRAQEELSRPNAPSSPTRSASVQSDHSSQSATESRRPKKTPSNFLVPPSASFIRAAEDYESPGHDPYVDQLSPRTLSPERLLPRLLIPGAEHDPNVDAPFPPYVENSPLGAASPRASSLRRSSSFVATSYPSIELFQDMASIRPLKWWPYQVLPSPQELVSTFFPTLWSWKNKSFWEKALGVVSAPSVFLLTLTLPVVESDGAEQGHKDTTNSFSSPPPLILSGNGNGLRPHSRSIVTIIEPPTSPTERTGPGNNGMPKPNGDIPGHANLPAIAVSPVQRHPSTFHSGPQILTPSTHPNHQILQSPEQLVFPDPIGLDTVSNPWNRWLIMLQILTAPFLIVLILWANMETDSPQSGYVLLRWILYGLLSSCITLAFILATTTAARAPKWRRGICFVGFAVSIAWISTIANEVVGVLKAIGVILNVSDAILGLTVFAVGNSLGDLVADITVARLGFPVMALSACFGGPMLNILLGIGVSGMYKTIAGAHARHERHPDEEMRYKPYHIEVSRTLIISGATLLVTLVGLLVAVPLRKWRMDRWIGIGLVSLWCLSTVGNLALELSGNNSTTA